MRPKPWRATQSLIKIQEFSIRRRTETWRASPSITAQRHVLMRNPTLVGSHRNAGGDPTAPRNVRFWHWEKHHRRSDDDWPVSLTLMIITDHCLVLTWGVEQPPGDRRLRSAVGKAGERHVAAFVDYDVLWDFIDAGWNCRHKKHHTSVKAALIHKLRLGGAEHRSFSGGGIFWLPLCLGYDVVEHLNSTTCRPWFPQWKMDRRKRFAEHFLLRLQHSEVLNSKLS